MKIDINCDVGEGMVNESLLMQYVWLAIEDADLSYDQIGQVYVGYVYGDSTAGQAAVYGLGMTGVPIINVNNNCSTGSSALFLARQAVESGMIDCALALGFEQMNPGALGSVYTDRPNPLKRMFKEMEALQASNENLLKEARAERDVMIKEAKDTANRMVEDAKGKAKEEAEKDTLPFWPYFVIKDLFALAVILVVFFAVVGFMPNFLGHPDNYIEANPLSTPAHIVPEWYFLPFYAILRAFTGEVWVVQFASFITGGQHLAHFRQLYIDQIAHGVLGVFGDAHGNHPIVVLGPFVAGGITQLGWNLAHCCLLGLTLHATCCTHDAGICVFCRLVVETMPGCQRLRHASMTSHKRRHSRFCGKRCSHREGVPGRLCQRLRDASIASHKRRGGESLQSQAAFQKG